MKKGLALENFGFVFTSAILLQKFNDSFLFFLLQVNFFLRYLSWYIPLTSLIPLTICCIIDFDFLSINTDHNYTMFDYWLLSLPKFCPKIFDGSTHHFLLFNNYKLFL